MMPEDNKPPECPHPEESQSTNWNDWTECWQTNCLVCGQCLHHVPPEGESPDGPGHDQERK